ncbi:zinc finger CCCH domain-containing protein [Trifolium repens]|nr:zinc finger CCCH domain-containing protein [Trifolium repens]
MREKERVERGGGRRSSSRAGSPTRNRRGYIHNVDQASISFFVTNFPTDCSTEVLWKKFAHYGRVGDIYIPTKVDKRGRKFGFVKFLEVKDEEDLNWRLQEVWIDTFKLRVNRSRFSRNEVKRSEGNQAHEVRLPTRREGEGSFQQGRSFRMALVKSMEQQLDMEKVVKSPENEVLQVEVDATVLKDLQESYVGVLALDIEVRRIITTLYMEGLPHIVVTDMGRSKVLLFSPRRGELESLCKSRADWMCYYFKEVKPWTPSSFVDRRDTWVKVRGIPLHAWGESLFKLIGGKYGEFLDFDEAIASRSKLDVARIKIATGFRSYIDELIKIKVLEVCYTIWVEEDKSFLSQCQGVMEEAREPSWVESSNAPAEAVEADGDVSCASMEVVEVEDRVDIPARQPLHEELVLHDGDNSNVKEGSSNNALCESADIQVATKGISFQIDVPNEGVVSDVPNDGVVSKRR